MRNLCYSCMASLSELTATLPRNDFIFFFSDNVTDKAEERAFAEAWQFMQSSLPCVIYYYSKYERTIYRKLRQQNPTRIEAELSSSSIRNTRSIFISTWCSKRRNGRHATTQSKRSPSISGSFGMIPIRRARLPSSGSTAGCSLVTHLFGNASLNITRTTAGPRASCWTEFGG